MTQPDPTPAGTLLDDAARWWEHVATSLRKISAGTYTPLDATNDSWWYVNSLSNSLRDWYGFAASPWAPMPTVTATDWSATFTVFPWVTDRPLTLTASLRPVGGPPNIEIAVDINPTPVPAGVNDVTVTLPFSRVPAALPRTQGWFLGGEITAQELPDTPITPYLWIPLEPGQ
jgi:hypothetical protein